MDSGSSTEFRKLLYLVLLKTISRTLFMYWLRASENPWTCEVKDESDSMLTTYKVILFSRVVLCTCCSHGADIAVCPGVYLLLLY